MAIYKHIMVGTDFSAQGDIAVQEALYLAKQHGAKLSIIHVIDERALGVQDSLPLSPQEFETMLMQEARRTLFEQFGDDGIDAIECHTIATFGKPLEVLCNYSKEQGTDLMIVGRRGGSMLKQLLLGSTAERLIRRSPVPVMLISGSEARGFGRVLVPVDGSDASRNALVHAVEFARSVGAVLDVLYVCEDLPISPLVSPHLSSTGDRLFASYESQMKEGFEDFLKEFDFGGFGYTAHFRKGTPDHEIVLCADEIKSDIVIMGTVGRTGLSGLLVGNTAERVSRQLDCSLLTLKPKNSATS